MEADSSVRRPFGITLLMVLGVIQGIVNILGGLFVILDRKNLELLKKSAMTPNQLLWSGIFAVTVGAVLILLALALGGGSEGVRILYAVVAIFNLGFGVYALFALHGEQQAAGALSATLGALAIYLLFNHRAETYFEARHA